MFNVIVCCTISQRILYLLIRVVWYINSAIHVYVYNAFKNTMLLIWNYQNLNKSISNHSINKNERTMQYSICNITKLIIFVTSDKLISSSTGQQDVIQTISESLC